MKCCQTCGAEVDSKELVKYTTKEGKELTICIECADSFLYREAEE